jgi:diguanylate cyclase (GGDEF)-like protein/PAS domain S-box-containing protein
MSRFKMADAGENKLLARLTAPEIDRLLPHLEAVELTAGQILQEAGQKHPYAYFPISGIVVLIQLTEDGRTAKIAMTGNDGLVGIIQLLGAETSAARAVVQTAGHAWRIRPDALRAEFVRGAGLMNQCLRYAQLLMAHVAQLVVCNRHHRLEQQLCRWMLFSTDRLPGGQIDCTQELIAAMLGVRRQGISEASAQMEADGIIRRQRGQITIIDRPQLEQRACECYRVVSRESDRLFTRLLVEPRGKLGLRPVVWQSGDPDRREAQAELALSSSNLAWWEQSLRGAESELSTSAYCNALLGYDPGELVLTLKEWNDRVHAEDAAARETAKCAHLDQQTPFYESEYRVRHKHGHWVWIASRGKLVEGATSDQPRRIVGTKMDITARKTAELALLTLNRTDYLTGAATRRHFFDIAERECARAVRHGLTLSLLALDLDHFKHINDEFGHATGDVVLQSFVSTVEIFLRSTDIFGRVGGEEFCILLPQTDQAGAAALAARILDGVRRTPAILPSQALRYTASLGVSSLNDKTSTFDGLLRAADKALYRAKSLGRDRQALALESD